MGAGESEKGWLQGQTSTSDEELTCGMQQLMHRHTHTHSATTHSNRVLFQGTVDILLCFM